MPVQIDLGRDALFSQKALEMLRDRYMIEGETSPQQAFARACFAFADDDAHAQRVYEYVSRQWFMFATPVLSNGGTKRGLPISCFLNYVPDSRVGLNHFYNEAAMLSSIGGGVGAYFGDVRSAGIRTRHGSAASGVIPYMAILDRYMLGFSQGVTRRGSAAVYIDINHPEIEEFLTIRKPTGGDANRKALNLHQGINVTDQFMELVLASMHDEDADDAFPLVDPHTQQVVRTTSARALWEKIIEMRMQTGEPYLNFIDTVNRELPAAQKKLGLKVRQSNLCTEITLPTGVDHKGNRRTAVCCLSSVNAEYFDEWSKVPQFIPDLVRMLDNVLQHFIDVVRGDPVQYADIQDAAYSAEQERALGLGLMGFHAFLQKMNVPFESAMSRVWNQKIFDHLRKMAVSTSLALGLEKGEAPDMAGTGMRNSHLIAVAPNASSSLICGETSPGVEPYRANCFTQKTLSGSVVIRNQYLDVLLKAKANALFMAGIDSSGWVDAQWASILANEGSCQHLDCLTDHEKSVFRTFLEIDQQWVIELAADRSYSICQAQSINLGFRADEDVAVVNAAHVAAWRKGVKSLYYLRSQEIIRAEDVGAGVGDHVKIKHDAAAALASAMGETCLSCEG